VHRINMVQGSCPCTGGCTVTWVNWEVIIGITIHDEMSNLRQKGAGSGQLRQELRARFRMIYHQEGINDSEVGGAVKFKFKR